MLEPPHFSEHLGAGTSLEGVTLGTTKNILRPVCGVPPLPWQTGQLRQRVGKRSVRLLAREPGLCRALCRGGDPRDSRTRPHANLALSNRWHLFLFHFAHLPAEPPERTLTGARPDLQPPAPAGQRVCLATHICGRRLPSLFIFRGADQF